MKKRRKLTLKNMGPYSNSDKGIKMKKLIMAIFATVAFTLTSATPVVADEGEVYVRVGSTISDGRWVHLYCHQDDVDLDRTDPLRRCFGVDGGAYNPNEPVPEEGLSPHGGPETTS